jgi:hypothetical protein
MKFEVITVFFLRIQIIWAMMLCRWMSSSQCFERL